MHRKHWFIMLLCCLIPMAGLLAIRVFQIPVNTTILFGLMLLCPISHIVLMKLLMDGHSQADEKHPGHEHVSTSTSLPDHRS